MKNRLTDKLPFTLKLRLKKWHSKIVSDSAENKPFPAAQRDDTSENRFRAIIFSDSLPEFDRDSGSLRLFQVLRIMARLGDVSFVPLHPKRSDFYETKLAGIGVETISALDFENVLRGENIDFIVLSRPDVADKIFPIARSLAPAAKIVFDTVDVHFVRLEREYQLTGDKNFLLEAEKLKKIETRIARAADQIWCVTAQDKEYLQEFAPRGDFAIVPNIHEQESRGESFEQRRGILFVGGFAHRPNTDAVKYFLDEIFPHVLKKLPDAKFHIVGSNPPPEIASRASESIIVEGFVPNIAPLFENCRVFVAPLRFGAGMKGKVGQALAHGLPVITTEIGAEGMNLNNEREVLIADAPEKFADAVCRVYRDENLWQQLSDGGFEFVEQMFSPVVVKEKIKNALQNIAR
jgi:glycosyltransferase involved in cell wall biosynthesis